MHKPTFLCLGAGSSLARAKGVGPISRESARRWRQPDRRGSAIVMPGRLEAARQLRFEKTSLTSANGTASAKESNVLVAAML